MITGSNLACGNPQRGRTELDYYATNPEAVRMLLDAHSFNGKNILEPCVGAGHIANVIEQYFGVNLTPVDIVDRGFPGTIVTDFLEWQTNKTFDTIITNPPYSLATEFIGKCIDLLEDDGQLAMFLKIQFLEGIKRKELFDKYPPRYVYVFRKRMPIFNNGAERDPKTGKPWVSTMCTAWYIWQKGFSGEPTIRWL